jgi:acetyl esterase/lipase
MKQILSVLFTIGAMLAAGQSKAHDSEVLLWPKGAPQAKGTALIDKPGMSIHTPEAPNGSAVIVNPGGGYNILAADHEGLQVARYLNRQGVTAFVLRYRIGPTYDSAISLLDAQRAIRFVRANYKQYHIDPDRIGMLGFSAGGHLASHAGTRFDPGKPDDPEPIERVSSRPDFLVLVYGAMDGTLFGDRGAPYTPTHKLVTDDTPPTFFLHTHEDTLVVPTHSIQFYQELLKRGIAAEMHIYNFGGHGLGFAPGDPELATWPDLMSNWFRRSGFYTPKDRVTVHGRVILDGNPVKQGWITFLPEDLDAPTAAATIGGEGKFTIDREHGPTAGEHTVRVYVQSFKKYGKTGEYSTDDVQSFATLKPLAPKLIEVSLRDGSEINLAITSR